MLTTRCHEIVPYKGHQLAFYCRFMKIKIEGACANHKICYKIELCIVPTSMRLCVDLPNAGLILNLEKGPFLQEVRENLEQTGNFYNFYPSQGKVREDKLFSQDIIFLNY